jgi:hypothetical protein
MTLKRLTIISSVALVSFALGRWLSPPAAVSLPAAETTQQVTEARVAETPDIPPAERAGRVLFCDLYRSLRAASAEDHAAYLRTLQALPSGPDRRAALSAFFHCMASISPQAAVDLVRQVGKQDIQRAAIAVMGVTPAPHTPLLVQMLLDLPADVHPEWRAQQLRGQMFFWAVLDPSAAAHFADQHRETDPALAASGIIGCMAAVDPAAAARWLIEHPELSKDPVVMTDYVNGLYSRDPAEARRYLIEHAAEEHALIAIASVAGRMFLQSADETAGLIEELPTREARRLALAAIAEIDLEIFANKETSHSSLYAGVAEWLTKFPQEQWTGTVSTLLSRWGHVDPNGPGSWVANLPPAVRPTLAGELVEHLAYDDLKQVLDSAGGDFRSDVLGAFARKLSRAPEDREALIDALGLSPADAAQLDAMAQSSSE